MHFMLSHNISKIQNQVPQKYNFFCKQTNITMSFTTFSQPSIIISVWRFKSCLLISVISYMHICRNLLMLRIVRHIHFRGKYIYLSFDPWSIQPRFRLQYFVSLQKLKLIVRRKFFPLFVVNVLMHRFHKCEVHCSFVDLKSIFEHSSEGKVHIVWRLDITKSSFYTISPQR